MQRLFTARHTLETPALASGSDGTYLLLLQAINHHHHNASPSRHPQPIHASLHEKNSFLATPSTTRLLKHTALLICTQENVSPPTVSLTTRSLAPHPQSRSLSCFKTFQIPPCRALFLPRTARVGTAWCLGPEPAALKGTGVQSLTAQVPPSITPLQQL